MFGRGSFRIFTFTKCIDTNATTLLCRTNTPNRMQTCEYAKKIGAKARSKILVKEDLKGPEVCKDADRLTSYAVGVNIFKQGDDPKLKPPEQYPEWLFQLHLGPPKKLNELDPDMIEYWNRLRKENIWRHNRLRKVQKF